MRNITILAEDILGVQVISNFRSEILEVVITEKHQGNERGSLENALY